MVTGNILPTFEQIFKPAEICFRLAGVPFVENSAITRQFVFLHLMMLTVDFEEICYFIPKLINADILEITYLIPCVITGLASLIKFHCLFLKRNKIIRVTNCLSELYVNLQKDPMKVRLIKDDVMFLKTVVRSYSILFASLLSLYVLKDVIWISYVHIKGLDPIYPLPFAIMLPVAIDNFYIWLFGYLQCSFGGCICICYVVGADVLFYVLTSHVCINLSIISHEIENTSTDDIEQLRKTIRYHQYVLELSNDLEDIFTGPNFYNYLSASLQICVLIFDLSIAKGKEIPQHMLFLICILLQIFLMSIFGENLIRKSLTVSDAAYRSQWYNMDEKMKKILLNISKRARQPQKLTSYKLHVLCYASFSRIISSSWSYFTILKTVYNPVDK